MRLFPVSALVIAAFWMVPLRAAEEVSTASLSSTPELAGSVLKVVLALVLVVGVILLLAWLARRFNLSPGFTSGHLRVLASLSLSPRERVVLIQAGERQLLLGVAPGRVSLLESYDKPLVSQEPDSEPVFSQRLRQALRQGKRVDEG